MINDIQRKKKSSKTAWLNGNQKKKSAVPSDKKINPNFIGQKNSVLSTTASLKSKCNLFENNENRCTDSIWIIINKCQFQSKFVLSQSWHHVDLLYSISEVINRHANLIKNLMLSCLNFQSRVGQYIGKNKNEYSSISFCI